MSLVFECPVLFTDSWASLSIAGFARFVNPIKTRGGGKGGVTWPTMCALVCLGTTHCTVVIGKVFKIGRNKTIILWDVGLFPEKCQWT